MIRAHFYHVSPDHVDRFEMTGHADSGPYGSDIVCAACSALAISTVNELNRVSDHKPVVKSDSKNGGFLSVSSISGEHDSQLLVDALFHGLNDVAHSYAKYIQVESK